MNQVPLWTFLGSVTQMISRFDFMKACYLDNLLLRLVTTYPSIIVYAFQLSYNIFRERKPHVPIRSVIQQILDAVNNPLMNKFIESLKCMTLPEKALKHHLDIIIRKLNQNTSIQRELKECYDFVFENPMRGKCVEIVGQLKNDMIEMMKGKFC